MIRITSEKLEAALKVRKPGEVLVLVEGRSAKDLADDALLDAFAKGLGLIGLGVKAHPETVEFHPLPNLCAEEGRAPMFTDYSKPDVPSNYRCGKCDLTGVKLWRKYQTFLREKPYRCASCAAEDECCDIKDIDANGLRSHEDYDGMRTDQIGSWIPAIPTEDNEACWGYTSTPDAGLMWWRRLPTLEAVEEKCSAN